MAKNSTPPVAQRVTFPCDCGKVHSFEAAHYDRVMTSCGRFWVLLQPKRDGPLVAFPPAPRLVSPPAETE